MDCKINLNVHTDGGARGNPGPSGIGVVLSNEDGKIIHKFGKSIGIATNNIAEYRAVLAALDWLIDNRKLLEKYNAITFFLDSQLVVSQLNGMYKVKNPNLKTLHMRVRKKEAFTPLPIHYTHVPRWQNREADKLVNLVLDNRL